MLCPAPLVAATTTHEDCSTSRVWSSVASPYHNDALPTNPIDIACLHIYASIQSPLGYPDGLPDVHGPCACRPTLQPSNLEDIMNIGFKLRSQAIESPCIRSTHPIRLTLYCIPNILHFTCTVIVRNHIGFTNVAKIILFVLFSASTLDIAFHSRFEQRNSQILKHFISLQRQQTS